MKEQVVLVGFENVRTRLGAAPRPCAHPDFCRRETPPAVAKAAPKPVLNTNARQVVEVLKQTEKNKRPRKWKTLTNHLVNRLQKKLSTEWIASAIGQLVNARLIGGTNSALAYNL